MALDLWWLFPVPLPIHVLSFKHEDYIYLIIPWLILPTPAAAAAADMLMVLILTRWVLVL